MLRLREPQREILLLLAAGLVVAVHLVLLQAAVVVLAAVRVTLILALVVFPVPEQLGRGILAAWAMAILHPVAVAGQAQ